MESVRIPRKGSKLLPVVLGIILVTGLSYLLVHFFFNKRVAVWPEKTSTVKETATTLTSPPEGTENWKTYTSKNGYMVSYPPGYYPNDAEFKYSVLFGDTKEGFGSPQLPTYFVSAFTEGLEYSDNAVYNFLAPQTVDTFFNAKLNEVVYGKPTYSQNETKEYDMYKKLPDLVVNNQPAVVVENTNVFGYKVTERQVLVKHNSRIYILGTYYSNLNEL